MNVTPELDARFRAAAVREGLVDVRYDVVDSPIGELLVAATDRGLCRIHFDPEGQEEELARIFGVRVLRSPLDDVRRELDEYFDGHAATSSTCRSTCASRRSTSEVLRELARVPYGVTTTYGALAAKVGRPKRRPRRRHGDEPQPDPDRAALPPHRRRERLADRLRGRARPKLQLLQLEGAILADDDAVVVVGGGFGGLLAAPRAPPRRRRGDARRPAELPPLPAARLPGRDRCALVGRDRRRRCGTILRRQRNAHVLLAEVTGFDLDRRDGAGRRPAERRRARLARVRHARRRRRLARTPTSATTTGRRTRRS